MIDYAKWRDEYLAEARALAEKIRRLKEQLRLERSTTEKQALSRKIEAYQFMRADVIRSAKTLDERSRG